MANHLLLPLIGVAMLMLTACDDRQDGPLQVSAIGAEPVAVNPNLAPLDAASSAMLLSTAQGLVRFDAAGQIEPGLAQSWIVSDDGLRYTFRLRRSEWEGGGRVTAAQVVERLRAAASNASRNPLKPLLGAVQDIEAMTDDVLEIGLVTPRPNFLQLLAQPELAIQRDGHGTGPYRAASAGGGAVSLYLPRDDDGEVEEAEVGTRDVLLRGEAAALAIARFEAGAAELVIGGDAGSLPLVRVSAPGRNQLRFDPALGLFGLSFGNGSAVQDGSVRRALAMAVDRAALIEALAVPAFAPRDSLVPSGVTELGQPALPDWSALPLPERRAEAAQAIRTSGADAPIRLRVAMPDGPGYRLIFAHLRRDWRAIGVQAERVPASDPGADLHFVDRVARVDLATWYLRQFTCDQSRICDPGADALLAEARRVPAAARRQALLAQADRLLMDRTVFIPLANPVRWSLVSTRLTGFAPNTFAHHNLGELIAERQ